MKRVTQRPSEIFVESTDEGLYSGLYTLVLELSAPISSVNKYLLFVKYEINGKLTSLNLTFKVELFPPRCSAFTQNRID